MRQTTGATRVTLLVLNAVLLGWSAGIAHAGPKKPQSEALQVARAAGFKVIRDVTADDVQAWKDKHPGSPGVDAAMGAGVAAGVLNPTQGLSASGEAGLLLLGAFLGSMPVDRPEHHSAMLAWLPKELAATREAATTLLRMEWARALAATLSDFQVTLKERPVEKKSQLRDYISIEGPGCADCRIYSRAFEKAGTGPRTEKSPDLLGAYKAYSWGRPGYRGSGSLGGYPWTVETLTPAERQEFFRELSANLPRWIFIYTAPNPKLAPYPQIFHQGKILLFIQPGLEAS